jgi:hypothetical protein
MAGNGLHPTSAEHEITVPDAAFVQAATARVAPLMEEATDGLSELSRCGADARLVLADIAARDASLAARVHHIFADMHCFLDQRRDAVTDLVRVIHCTAPI